MYLSEVQIKSHGVETLGCYNMLISQERHLYDLKLTCELKPDQKHFYCGDFLCFFFTVLLLGVEISLLVSPFFLSVFCSCF